MRRTLAGWLTATMLSGAACHTMAPLSWDEVDGLQPSRVWITQANQSVVQVSGPQVFGDTLVGYVNGEFREMPTTEVKQVTVRRTNRAKTLGLIAASTVGAAAIAVWMSGVGEPSERQDVDCDYEVDDPRCT